MSFSNLDWNIYANKFLNDKYGSVLHNVGNHHSSVERHVGSFVHGQRVGVVVWLVPKILFLLHQHYYWSLDKCVLNNQTKFLF